MFKKFLLLVGLAFLLFLLSGHIGLTFHQSTAIAIFSVSILGTLFFWDFRLTFAFLGTSILLITQTIDVDNVIKFSSLEVIFFLIGMMVLVGLLKSAGFFAWILSLILRIKHLTAIKFVVLISVISALLACAVDEVTSIIFVVAAIFEICDYFEVDPAPFLIISVLATNIGSSGTALGNPIGILIASKSGLTFEDFLLKAFPVMLVSLLAMIGIVLFWYRDVIAKLGRQMQLFGDNEILLKLIAIPPEKELRKALLIFGTTLVFIALHHRLELYWGLKTNTILLTVPLISSGLVMAWKHHKARSFIEKDVEWWTLLFFLLLFAQAGTLKYTGATDVIAHKLIGMTGNNIVHLTGLILWVATLGSSILDNVVLVAAFIPIVQSFEGVVTHLQPLWWALLFGGCFGGNITLVGSTANIVALGILEKERKVHLTFFRWVGIGLTVGVVTTCIVWAALIFLPFYK